MENDAPDLEEQVPRREVDALKRSFKRQMRIVKVRLLKNAE